MRPRLLPALCLLLALAAAGCEDPEGPEALRNLGDECLSCHKPDGKARRFLYSAGGTVYPTADENPSPGLAGVRLTLTGADGKRVEARTNSRGNFWTRAPLAFPVAVEIWREGSDTRKTVAAGPCSAGTCNACHTRPPKGGAPGRIYAPR